MLGMKKRGFGKGRWNGFGGKVEHAETIEESVVRETKEESGIEVVEPVKVGVLDFAFEGDPVTLEAHIFRAETFRGEPHESEEMRPQWFSIDEIPFDEMWPDDRHWFPLLLAGKKFTGRFLFGAGDQILKKELSEVEELE